MRFVGVGDERWTGQKFVIHWSTIGALRPWTPAAFRRSTNEGWRGRRDRMETAGDLLVLFFLFCFFYRAPSPPVPLFMVFFQGRICTGQVSGASNDRSPLGAIPLFMLAAYTHRLRSTIENAHNTCR